ncbi:hypothetical protein IM660_02400 [Ruania alkalisoli]|uniref:Uncharacterized protein n=1 Tax=Ruania alkalisoli TaxID=2779775 RepID=A0A7M1SWR6_9MICO|nr:hypothetical protein [Ruania alkalisoli]QOR71182.1 hypothetical protein IM660_02400 [Ruania alkalisoli]
MSTPADPAEYDEVQLLEEDENIPPRPEEEAADLLRSEPADRTPDQH